MASPPPEVNYKFNAQELEALKPYGEIIAHEKGDVLFKDGDKNVDLCVVLSGQLDVMVITKGEKQRVGWMEPGQFAGDLSVLTGQAVLASAHMETAGDVLHIDRANFQRLLVENSHLSDVLVTALTARRTWARSGGKSSVVVLGAPFERQAFAIRDMLTKHGVPHAFVDADEDPYAEAVLKRANLTRDDIPAVVQGFDNTLVKPTISQIAEAFGLDILPDGACADVIVVGAGPGGLAASVYAASEGLSVLTLDAQGPGGQAGTSSKIENYLGFPTGISGADLAQRASIQAQKFGARLVTPCTSAELARDGDDYCMTLKDGRKLKSRAVVLAMGAQYRKLPVDNLEQFEGRGVYYGATPMEAQLCGNADIAIVGAGNSAGQGAVFLAESAANVHVLYRRANIRDTMSEYLVRRLEEMPNIHLHPESSITALRGCEERLRKVTVQRGADKSETDYEIPFVFLFIGAQPCTDWLDHSVATDESGFLKTGSDIENIELVRAGWSLDRMPSRFETNWPRVYAVGDVRSGSIKRVASSVGEGSVVVSDVHKALAESH